MNGSFSTYFLYFLILYIEDLQAKPENQVLFIELYSYFETIPRKLWLQQLSLIY